METPNFPFLNEYELSYPVDPVTYDLQDFDNAGPVRRHKYEAEMARGAEDFRADWRKYVGNFDTIGMENPSHGCLPALVCPQCKPDRLHLIGYFTEFAFFYDEYMEQFAEEKYAEHNDDNLTTNRSGSLSAASVVAGLKQIKSKIFLRLLEIDPVCASQVLEGWQTWASSPVNRDRMKPFQNIDEYTSYRILESGSRFEETLLFFSLGIILTEDEYAQFVDLFRESWTSCIVLSNDYFSFDIEYERFKQSGATELTNAVWLYMKWDENNVEMAKSRVKDLCIAHGQRFIQRMEDFTRNSHSPTGNLRRLLDGLALALSGNLVWCSTCPRYNPQFRSKVNNNTQIIPPKLNVRPNLREPQRVPIPKLNTSFSAAIEEQLGSSPEWVEHSGRFWSPSSSSDTIDSMSRTPSIPQKSEERCVTITDGMDDMSSEYAFNPYEYMNGLPRDDVYDTFIDALNVWFKASDSTIGTVKRIVNMLHSASLMLDDIEDGYSQRHGDPATHTIFGTPLTVNSAHFTVTLAMQEAQNLPNTDCANILLREVMDMFIGRSYELHWTRHCHCPSELEYLGMIDKKIGGLFRLAARLLQAHAAVAPKTELGSQLNRLVILLGRLVQIRDDYQTFQSAEYASSKGFCEDLDKGKYSYPMIQALKGGDQSAAILQGIMQERRTRGLSETLKKCVLDQLDKTDSLKRNKVAVDRLQAEIAKEIIAVEHTFAGENWIMKLLLLKLSV